MCVKRRHHCTNAPGVRVLQHDGPKYAFTSAEAEARAGGKSSKAAAEEVDEVEEEEVSERAQMCRVSNASVTPP